ncbi:MAG TPA: GNAT family N-acetyltransferase [Xanthomonadales bacterium]|nr:GNAT family N-acetyltransferase [Xanthomonadales bacterium]
MTLAARERAAPAAALRFGYLADAPQHAATLAQWHLGAWGALLRDWTVAAAQAELETHRAHCAIPTTIVAYEGDELAGSASLLANDHERIRAWSPWLASVFVRPSSRGRGIGRALVERVVADARALRVQELYLYTTDAVAYYEALGWKECGRMTLDAVDVVVMCVAPAGFIPSPTHVGEGDGGCAGEGVRS